MEFRLDAGQTELQQTVARFCADRFPLDAVASREGAPVDRGSWAAMAELGLFGLLASAGDGDDGDDGDDAAGLGVVEAAIVFEQLGGHLAPGPVLWTVLAAGLVAGAATGERLVAGVEAEAVDGGSVVVEHAADVDVLLVVDDHGVVAHATAGLAPPVPLEGLDPLATVGRVPGLTDGEPVGGPEVAAALRLRGRVLTAAQLVGVASRALDVAREYALERQQFGAPIGSFQAVKHLLADMYVRLGIAQSATYAAAAVLQDPGTDDPVRAAATAKLLAGEAAVANASTAVQVLGGMGFTWDMLPNHLLKRAWSLEQDFGVGADHELLLGSTLVAAGP